MNCSKFRKLLHAHYDGELDAAHEMEVGEHLAGCSHCFEIIRNLATLRGVLQNDALRFSAPAGLLRAIMRAVQTEIDATAEPKRSRNWIWAAAAILLAAAILAFQFEKLHRDDRVLAELTASHIRSLMAGHLTDFASTDQHTVQPSFDGVLTFVPPVKDLYSAGYPLLGCRLDYVADHPVAALVYSRQKHPINLFIWPASASTVLPPHATQHNGYHIVRWSDGQLDLAAVSDLNEAELREFAVTYCHREWQSL